MHIPIDERTPPQLGGKQKIYRFDNDYGASVVRHPYSYGGNKGLWELAVIEFSGDDAYDWTITYSTEITNDVIGHLSSEEIEALLDQIKALPKPKSVAA